MGKGLFTKYKVKSFVMVLLFIVLFLLSLSGVVLFVPLPNKYIKNKLNFYLNSAFKNKEVKILKLKVSARLIDIIIKRGASVDLQVDYADNVIGYKGAVKFDPKGLDIRNIQLDGELNVASRAYPTLAAKTSLKLTVTLSGQAPVKAVVQLDQLELTSGDSLVARGSIDLDYVFLDKSLSTVIRLNGGSFKGWNYEPVLLNIESTLSDREDAVVQSAEVEFKTGTVLWEPMANKALSISPAKGTLRANIESTGSRSAKYRVAIELPLPEFEWLNGDVYITDTMQGYSLESAAFVSLDFTELLSVMTTLRTPFGSTSIEAAAPSDLWTLRVSWQLNRLQDLIDTLVEKGLLNAIPVQVIHGQVLGFLRAKTDGTKTHILDGGQVQFKDLAVEDSKNAFAVKGLNLEYQLSRFRKLQSSFRIDEILFKNWSLSLGEIQLETLWQNDRFEVSQISGGLIKENSKMWGQISTFSGAFPGSWQKSIPFDAKFKFDHQSLNAAWVYRGMCLPEDKGPPFKIHQGSLGIEISNRRMKLLGDLQGDIFGGRLRVYDIEIDGWNTFAPTTQLNVELGDVRLDKVSDWAKLGKMDGYLGGYFKDAVFKGSLLTQFRGEIAARPRKTAQVIFSGEAMENFVSLLTPQDITAAMPGIVKWVTFGWPSDLIGGFNIDYAGVTLFSQGGSILLQTLEEDQTDSKERFILKGNRFSIPIVSSHYPVILDAYGVRNFLQHVQLQIQALQDQEKSGYNQQQDTKNSEREVQKEGQDEDKCKRF